VRQIDVIWLAGLLEGEGCFNIRPDKNNQVRVSIEMTDRDIIERAAKLFGSNVSQRAPRVLGTCNQCGQSAQDCIVAQDYAEGTKTYKEAERYFSVTKRSYQTAIYGDRARNLMRLVYPFMGQRRAAKIEECLGSLV
jgi:hypothetical protein